MLKQITAHIVFSHVQTLTVNIAYEVFYFCTFGECDIPYHIMYVRIIYDILIYFYFHVNDSQYTILEL